MEAQSITAAQLAQVAQALAPGGRLLRTWPLAGGSSAMMIGLEIAQAGGSVRKAVMRLPSAHPHAAAAEHRILQLVHKLGLAAPAPLLLDESRSIISAPYLVIEHIDGQLDFAPADHASAGAQMAAQLAAIHRIAPLDIGQLPSSTSCPELARPPSPTAPELRAEQLRARLSAVAVPPTRNQPALLHGDYWPGNVLWRDGTLVAVVDWEDAKCGDPLSDLAISRLDVLWIYGRTAFAAFNTCYCTLMSIDYSALPYWDLCAALRIARLAGADLAAWAGFFARFGRHDITAQSFCADFAWFVAQAEAQLDTSSKE